MSFSFKLNQNDLNRIKKKLEATVNAAQKEGSALYRYRFNILDEYRKSIVSVMGVVDGDSGGSATSSRVLAKSFSVNWDSLSNMTLNVKRKLGYKLTIWEASGETKRSVSVKGNFAGIDSKDNLDAFYKALETEFGGAHSEGEIPDYSKRALFTIANQLVLDNLEQIKIRLASGFIKTAKENGWGSN